MSYGVVIDSSLQEILLGVLGLLHRGMNKTLTKCQVCSHAKWFGEECRWCNKRVSKADPHERKEGHYVRSCDKCGDPTFRQVDIEKVICYWCKNNTTNDYTSDDDRLDRDRLIYKLYENDDSLTFADIAEFPDIDLTGGGVRAAYLRYKEQRC